MRCLCWADHSIWAFWQCQRGSPRPENTVQVSVTTSDRVPRSLTASVTRLPAGKPHRSGCVGDPQPGIRLFTDPNVEAGEVSTSVISTDSACKLEGCRAASVVPCTKGDRAGWGTSGLCSSAAACLRWASHQHFGSPSGPFRIGKSSCQGGLVGLGLRQGVERAKTLSSERNFPFRDKFIREIKNSSPTSLQFTLDLV